MKNRFTFLLLLVGFQVFGQDFKVVGYLPYYRFSLSDQVDYSKLTHLNLAFANPDMQGNLDIGGQDIDPIVQLAKQENVTVCISLAGGGLTTEWAAAWAHLTMPANRSPFISKIMDYVRDHELDGVDVDLEWSHVNDDYSGFVLELRDSIDQYGWLMTAALPGTYRYPQISTAAMEAYDFINMMVYDLTGPWDANNPGQHSPYSFAVSAISYWQNQGMPADQLTLGVPFYGWNFNQAPGSVTSVTFGGMVSQNTDYAQIDQVGQIYYNGIPTIQAKTALALEEVSGIMIWELGQDAFNDYSLLSAIDAVISGTVSVEPPLPLPEVDIYPNPFVDYLNVNNQSETFNYTLSNANGSVVVRGQVNEYSTLQVPTNQLPAGFYVLNLVNGQQSMSWKLIKR